MQALSIRNIATPAKIFALFASVVLCFCLPASAQVPASGHIILVIEENTSFNTTVSFMPWLTNQGNINGYANNFTTDSGGSLLDYLWLSSGSCHTTVNCAPSTMPTNTNDFNCDGEACGGGTPGVITDDNIFRELDAAGISWKVYAESLPNVGYLDDGPYPYVRRHNPAVWYSDVFNDQSKVVPFEDPNVGFAADMANGTLPTYSIIIPNLEDDAHDCPGGGDASTCSAAVRVGPADDWLANNVAPVLNQPFFQPGGDGLLIITFDNGDFDDPGQVYTAFIGPNVIPGTVSNTAYMHENTLRTILDSLGITNYMGAAVNASDMFDFF
jgi:acid phosphatase